MGTFDTTFRALFIAILSEDHGNIMQIGHVLYDRVIFNINFKYEI